MNYYNDFQRMVRSNHLEDVISKYREWRGRECLTPEQVRAHADVADVLDSIYRSSPASHVALIRLARICSRLSKQQFGLLIHILRGGTFTEYAIGEGVTGAAIGQRWSTVVSRLPILKCIRR